MLEASITFEVVQVAAANDEDEGTSKVVTIPRIQRKDVEKAKKTVVEKVIACGMEATPKEDEEEGAQEKA